MNRNIKDCYILYRYLYDDSNIEMKRKRVKYKKLILSHFIR